METVGEAVEVFLARRDSAASSRHSDRQTLNRLATELGRDRALGSVEAARSTSR